MRHRTAEPISFPATTTTVLLISGPGQLMGWGVKETGGVNPASLDIFDGDDATGQIVVPITLVANESARDWNSPDGIEFSRGIFVRVNSGSVSGAVWVRKRWVGSSAHEFEATA